MKSLVARVGPLIRISRAAALVCGLTLLPFLLASALPTHSLANLEEGVPTFCPERLPPTTGFSLVIPGTFHVQRWQQPAGAEVPFTAGSYELTTRIQNVLFGQGWYIVHPRTTTYDEIDWRWESDAGPGGILCSCRFVNLVVWSFVRISWTGQIYGYAWPIYLDGSTTTTRPGGASEGEWQCWELVMYGYDEMGVYWEVILDEWCEFVGNQT